MGYTQKQCKWCGNLFNVLDKKESKREICSRKCRKEYNKSPNRIEERKKISTKNLQNYNSKIQSGELTARKHTEEHKIYMSELYKGRNISWKEKIKETHWSKDEKKKKDVINKLKETKNSYSEERKQEISKKMSVAKIKSLSTHGGNMFSIQGKFLSKKTNQLEHFHSLYEYKKMVMLDEDEEVIFWTKKHKFIIEYNDKENKTRRYLPDFYIEKQEEKIIEELKSDYTNKKDKNSLFKQECLKKFCSLNNLISVWTIWKLNYYEEKYWLNHLNEKRIL